MDRLLSLEVFTAVVDRGSFAAAARALELSRASVTEHIQALEKRLKTKLINRTTRRIALTEAGERYLQRCEQILAYVDQAEAEAGDAHARPSGKLKVHSMTSFGQHYAVPMISRYQAHHPSVQVDLTLAQRMPDLLDEGYDVSLVLASELPDSGLVSQRLGSVFSIVCASPAYIARHGTPHVLSDLASHACLQLITPVFPPDKWTFDGPNGQETVGLGPTTFTVNVADALAVAIQEGMGIGVLPTPSALPGLRAGKLVRVLPQYTMQELSVYALYPSRQYLDAKIRTWVDFMRDELPATLARDVESLKEFVLDSAGT